MARWIRRAGWTAGPCAISAGDVRHCLSGLFKSQILIQMKTHGVSVHCSGHGPGFRSREAARLTPLFRHYCGNEPRTPDQTSFHEEQLLSVPQGPAKPRLTRQLADCAPALHTVSHRAILVLSPPKGLNFARIQTCLLFVSGVTDEHFPSSVSMESVSAKEPLKLQEDKSEEPSFRDQLKHRW
jgi:hypothetical protein